MSYAALSSDVASDLSKEARVQGERYLKFAATVDPDAKAVVEFLDGVFAVADELGIGQEVRTVFYDTYAGAMGGAVSGAAISTAVGGASLAAGVAAGMAAGGIVGVAVAVFALVFGDDQEDEKKKARQKRRKARNEAMALALKRLDLPGLITEQRVAAFDARERAKTIRVLRAIAVTTSQKTAIAQMGNAGQLEEAARIADAMVKLYEELPRKLSPQNVQRFVAMTNMGRWEQYKAEFAQQEAKLRAQLKVFQFPGIDDESLKLSYWQNAQAKLEQLIAAEEKRTATVDAGKFDAGKFYLRLGGKKPLPAMATAIALKLRSSDAATAARNLAKIEASQGGTGAVLLGLAAVGLASGVGWWWWKRRR